MLPRVRLNTVFSPVVVILVCSVLQVSTNYPDETGGYSITVAFDEAVPVPSNGEAVTLFNIITSMNTFSAKLWQTSHNRFYIKSVDILVPSSWGGGVRYNHSTHHNYNTAAIRITSSSERAYADNPFPCGKPGNFIQLPTSFFNTLDSGGYGVTWKALLNLWASYRWGVYEEHGYVGNTKYPYSFRDVQSNTWQVTGCSDQPIPGRFQSSDLVSCTGSDTLNSSSSCRFIPDQQLTTATTSLMHFHWIDSIVGFCDESNHNKFSPNRQNSLCDRRSVWEVIRDTRDYQIVNNPSNVTLPSIAFAIVKHSPKPNLYILLDRGKIQGSVALASQTARAIANFLGDIERNNTIAKVGTFPGRGSEAIETIIDWLPVGENLDKFAEAFGTVSLNGSLQRNFPNAILAAVKDTEATAHPNGIVMLVVKYGADLSNFGEYVSESEVLQAVTEQGIVLNAIELKIANHNGHSHLANVAQKTGGLYTVISNTAEASTSLSNVFWYMDKLLKEDHQELKKNYRTILRTNVASGSTARFRVPKSSAASTAGKVEVYFASTEGSLSSSNFIVRGINANGSTMPVSNVRVTKRQDWLESGSKWTYTLEFSQEMTAPYSEVTIQINCVACVGSMLIQTDVMNDASQNVTVSVFTNADNPIIDLSRNDPLILFAKIFNSSTPVVNAQVTAVITETTTQKSIVLHLMDNGEGSPDEEISDGIYSQYFIPDRDGDYKVSINVGGTNALNYAWPKNAKLFALEPYKQELLPIDQDMGCNGAMCDTAMLTGDFLQSIDLPINLQISNTDSYIPEPAKISMFITPAADPETLSIRWISPSVPGTHFSVASYDCRYSISQESLFNDFENQEQVPGISSLKPKVPGSPESFSVAKPSVTTFYAIRSLYRTRMSKMSELSVIEIRDAEETTTTASPTTTDTPDTSSASTSSQGPSVTTPTGTTSSGQPTQPTTTTDGDDTNTGASPTTTKKPWAKTGGGIAVITIAVIIAVVVIIFGAYYFWKTHLSKRDSIEINPPPAEPRPQTDL